MTLTKNVFKHNMLFSVFSLKLQCQSMPMRQSNHTAILILYG